MIPFGIPLAAAGALLPNPLAFFRARLIGFMVANITIDEHHVDELQITDHPVERGSTISDHAFKVPERVTIHVGYSNSSPMALGDPNYVENVYRLFLTLQETREPFVILTGKRFYQDMLIQRLSTETDEKSENSMILRVDCRRVIIVETQVVSTGLPATQKDPAATAGITNEGTKQPVAAPPTFNPDTFSNSALPQSSPGFAALGLNAFEIPISATPPGSMASLGATPATVASP